ncbi:hypothetical protein HK104_000469 [Borealophlyctis nickersoniae]|nr:hypothetical protein HK104_000469 [Borealophlyctis nickersoniae]
MPAEPTSPRTLPSPFNIFHTNTNLSQGAITSSPTVDSELYKVLGHFIQDYVSVWYEGVSQDEEFISEILSVVARVVKELERRLRAVDWIALSCLDLPEIFRRHLHDYRHCKEKVGTAYAGGRGLEELFRGCQPHFALRTAETEAEYLRRVVELLMEVLLPQEELKSDCVRYLVREILTNSVFGSAVERFCDPDYINQTFLMALSDQTGGLNDDLEDSPSTAVMDLKDKGKGRGDVGSLDEGGRKGDGLQKAPAYQLPPPYHDASSPENHLALFNIKTPAVQTTFLKRQRRPPRVNASPQQTNSGISNQITSGLSKLTLGGMDKVSNGLGRIKNMIGGPKEAMDSSTSSRKKKAVRSRSRAFTIDEIKPPRFRRRGMSPPVDIGDDDDTSDAASISFSDHFRSRSLRRHSHDSTTGGGDAGLHAFRKVHRRTYSNTSNPSAPSEDASVDGDTDEDTISRNVNTRAETRTSNVRSSRNDRDSSSDALDYLDALDETSEASPITPDDNADFRDRDGKNARSDALNVRVVKDFWARLVDLYRDTTRGPSHLGPIDTTRYHGEHLDEPLYDLINEALQLTKRQKWLYTQVMFFVKPVVHGFAGSMINRLIMKSVYSLISENQVANYISMFRMSMWPNGYPVEEVPPRSPEEQQATLTELETKLRSSFPPILETLLGEDAVQETSHNLIQVFQSKSVNKHLFYILLDLILVHLVPEVLDSGQEDGDTVPPAAHLSSSWDWTAAATSVPSTPGAATAGKLAGQAAPAVVLSEPVEMESVVSPGAWGSGSMDGSRTSTGVSRNNSSIGLRAGIGVEPRLGRANTLPSPGSTGVVGGSVRTQVASAKSDWTLVGSGGESGKGSTLDWSSSAYK